MMDRRLLSIKMVVNPLFHKAKSGTPDNTTNALRIGARNAPSAASNFFYGKIDEVRISNIARSEGNIEESYQAGRDHRLSKTITAQIYPPRRNCLSMWRVIDRGHF